MENTRSFNLKPEILSVENLTKKFGNFTAVENLNLSIQKNEIFGFLGPNGAGKSTTINMICGLIKPTNGKIIFNGNNSANQFKSNIGYCPQENIFYPKLTCLEQLVFIGEMHGLKASKAKNKGAELLSLLGLTEKSDKLASSLSGGMKRRLNICLSIIHEPEILILDEPEAGLDPQSRILVRDFIKQYSQNKTIIITTHNMDEADRLAHRIAIIDYGKLLLLDTPENLKKTIGEGDILNLVCESTNRLKISQIPEFFPDYRENIKIIKNEVLIKAKNVIEKTPEISNTLKSKGYIIKEIRLRENTLEDVFIHLTGRHLRQ